jgi:hypothetical protein
MQTQTETQEISAQAFDQAGELIDRQHRILSAWQGSNRAQRRAEMRQPHLPYFTKKYKSPKSREKARQSMLEMRGQAKLDLMAMASMIKRSQELNKV